jgi:2-methylisocitrate lyase-like PEP mutase family enzyme
MQRVYVRIRPAKIDKARYDAQLFSLILIGDFMTNAFAHFKELHHSNKPLLMPNAWDAASARLIEAAGASAIATSSAAFLWALGYADGEPLPREEFMGAIRRIARVIKVPLTVDVINGYSDDPVEVADFVREAVASGACGINLEDGMDAPELLVKKIQAIRDALGSESVFINARTDVYLAGLASGDAAVAMTIERLQDYQDAGADGGFVPGLTDVAATSRIAKAIHLPLALMIGQHEPTIRELHAAGARRFTIGPSLFQSVYDQSRALAKQLIETQSTQGWFAHQLGYGDMNQLIQK